MKNSRYIIYSFNVLNLILLACFFEVLAYPFVPFRYTKTEWIKEKEFTFEFNRYSKTRKLISMYARGSTGRSYVLMCKGKSISELDIKTPFLLYISEDRIFGLPVKAMPEGVNESFLLKEFVPVIFLCCFGILVTSILFFYHKNLSGQVAILFFMNIAIVAYFIYLSLKK
ncbi:MAG: hypothetical protein N3F09_04630 [Bacteroidia bacterium]|nr:hypothetical protein [Bacteroidia bacterium]